MKSISRWNSLFFLSVTAGIIYFLSAVPAFAQLVPCGHDDNPCDICHFVELGNNVLTWLIGVLMVIFAIIAAYAGFKLVTSAGNVQAYSEAKGMLGNAIIGLIIVLAGWILIDTVMKSLLRGTDGVISGYGPWSKIACGVQYSGIDRIYHPVPDGGRGVAAVGGVGSFDPATVSALAAISAPDDKVKAAAAAAGLDAEQARNLQALMRVESSGCTNKISPVGALGCMQIMPTTAVQYDKRLVGLSDAELRERLMNDDYNIELGAKIYKDLYTHYNGDVTKVYAAYNGGPGANSPSRDCPGYIDNRRIMRWECEWDNPQHTIPNIGYIETRNYVKKVAAVSAQLK